MVFSDLLIRILKYRVPLEELVEMLHRWYDKSSEEIAIQLEAHGFDPKEIKGHLVNKGLKVSDDLIHESAVKILALRLKEKGMSADVIKHVMMSAGFVENELKKVQDFVSSDMSELQQDASGVMVFPPQREQP